MNLGTNARRLGGALAGAIVAIWASHASAEPDRCAAAPEGMGHFQTAGEGAEAPDQAFLRDGTEEVTLADYRGRGVVLNFWATWCAPCVQEMPGLDALHAALAKAGVDVLAVSADLGGAKTVERFYSKSGIDNLPVLLDQRGRLANALRVHGLPTTILIDADGRERGRVVGTAHWDAPDVAAFLRACLSPDS